MENIKKYWGWFMSNIQLHQTIVLITILLIGLEFYPIYFDYTKLLVVFSTVIFCDYFFHYLKTGKHKIPYSGVNPGFGISFFLRTDELIIYFFAGVVAIASKYLIQTKEGRHFLNPSNIGVVIALLLFQQYAWVDTLQWGNYTGIIYQKYIIILSIMISLGIYMSYRVYKLFKYNFFLDYISVFILAHLVLFFTIPAGESLNSFIAFFTTTFFIFTFFMITDPKTIPQKSSSRPIFAINIALAFYLLQFFVNEAYALILSLTINSFTLPIIWKLEAIENKKYNVFFLLTISIIMILFILLFIYIYGRPDLWFHNVCDKLICR